MPWARPVLLGNETARVAQAVASTMVSGGPFVERIERELAMHHGLPGRGLAVCNGTAALELALLGLDVGPGDEVIVPGWGFMAGANMVLARGATPIFADVAPDTWLVTPDAIESKLGRRTRAILVIHSFGNMCDMPRVCEIAARQGVAVIEDVAQAIFSRYDGQIAGSWSDVACFSFQATKTITAGEGGFVLSRQTELHRRMRLIANHGMTADRKYFHVEMGHNFRMTNLQAALLTAQFEQKDRLVRMRQRVFERYVDRLADAPDVTLQRFDQAVEPAPWGMPVRLNGVTGDQRDDIITSLAADGVETRPGFASACQQPIYDAPTLPVSRRLADEVIALPAPADLSRGEIDLVCERLIAHLNLARERRSA